MKRTGRVFYLINGLIAMILGAIFTFSELSVPNLFLVPAGIWATILGLYQIVIAPQMQKKVRHHGLFTLNGIITLTSGLLLFYNPSETRVLMVIIGLMALLAGVGMVYLGYNRRLQ